MTWQDDCRQSSFPETVGAGAGLLSASLLPFEARAWWWLAFVPVVFIAGVLGMGLLLGLLAFTEWLAKLVKRGMMISSPRTKELR